MGVEPYPSESPAGPMVAITNEFAGSDGDIFSHSWKLFKLGKINFSLNSKNYNQIEMVHHIWLLLVCDYITKTKF